MRTVLISLSPWILLIGVCMALVWWVMREDPKVPASEDASAVRVELNSQRELGRLLKAEADSLARVVKARGEKIFTLTQVKVQTRVIEVPKIVTDTIYVRHDGTRFTLVAPFYHRHAWATLSGNIETSFNIEGGVPVRFEAALNHLSIRQDSTRILVVVSRTRDGVKLGRVEFDQARFEGVQIDLHEQRPPRFGLSAGVHFEHTQPQNEVAMPVVSLGWAGVSALYGRSGKHALYGIDLSHKRLSVGIESLDLETYRLRAIFRLF